MAVFNLRLAITSVLLLTTSTATLAQSAGMQGTRAKPGDQVVLIINAVKADKRQQFENYMTKFLAALTKASQTDEIAKRIGSNTRLLEPAEANSDGTFTYIFLADPVVAPPSEYDMAAILKKVHSESEAAELGKQFLDSIIVDRQQVLVLIQSESDGPRGR